MSGLTDGGPAQYNVLMLTQAHAYVKGDVTKVGFRAWIRIKAKECKVTGWTRNVYDKIDIFGPHGGVEVIIQGDKEAVKDMIDCIQEGSTISRIDDVEVRYEDPKEIIEGFTVYKSKSYNPLQ